MSRLLRIAKAVRPLMVQQQAMFVRPNVMRPVLSNILSKSFGSDAHAGKDEVIICNHHIYRRQHYVYYRQLLIVIGLNS